MKNGLDHDAIKRVSTQKNSKTTSRVCKDERQQQSIPLWSGISS